MSDGSMTVPYVNCKYHDLILIFGYNYILNQCVHQSFTCSFTLHRPLLTHTLTFSLTNMRTWCISIGVLSHMLTHSLPRCLSRIHALDITLPPSHNHLRLFSLTFITSTLPLTSLHTYNPHRPFLYT